MQKFVAPDNNSESKPWDSDTWNARTSNTQIFPVASLHSTVYPSMHKSKICVTKCSIVDRWCLLLFYSASRSIANPHDMPSVSLRWYFIQIPLFRGSFFGFSHKLMARLRLLCMDRQIHSTHELTAMNMISVSTWALCGLFLSHFTNCIRHLYFYFSATQSNCMYRCSE